MDFNRISESHGDGDEEKIVFYYNRQERLKHAPKNVQDLYNGNFKVFKPGLFKALVSTKTNRLAFVAMVMCFVLVIFLGIFNKKNEGTLSEIPFELSAFSFNEQIYASLKIEEPSKKHKIEGNKNFDVKFKFLDKEKNLVYEVPQLLIYEGKEAFLRTTYHDYDIFYVITEIETDKKVLELTATVDKR